MLFRSCGAGYGDPMVRLSFRFGALTSRYGERAVLDGLDGEIASGCLTALIGPNGSGKSTLLRVLAGLQPYGGTLTLDGREARSLSRWEFGRRVGVVPQQVAHGQERGEQVLALAQRLAQFVRGHGGGVAAGRVGDVVVPQGPGDGQDAVDAQHAQCRFGQLDQLLR